MLQRKTKKRIRLFLIFTIIFSILVTIGGIYWIAQNYVYQSGHFYPRDSLVLDVRDKKLSARNYESLSRKMQGAAIVWSVPFGDVTVSSDAAEVTMCQELADHPEMFAYLPKLSVVHAEQWQDYESLLALRDTLPDVQLKYRVTIDGTVYNQDTQKVTAPNLTAQDAQLLDYLPMLETVDASGCTEYAFLQALQDSHPQWDVHYSVLLCGQTVDAQSEEVTLPAASAEDLEQACLALRNLKKLTLIEPVISGEALLAFREQHPELELHWQLTVQGVQVADDTVELDFTGAYFENIQQAADTAAYCPNLELLNLSSCGLDSEAIAGLREEKRQEYKVVWTIRFTDNCIVRSDTTYFMPTKEGEYYFFEEYIHDMIYLEDCVAVDMGHHPIRSCEFVRYMPNLKYLILAHTQVRDITPLSSCKSLLFLELDHSYVSDYTPLQGCTALEDLNLGMTYGDAAPVGEMTWLKNLWWLGRSNGVQRFLRETLPDTHLNFAGDATVANGWRRLQNYYDMRDALGMYYMEW